MDQRLLVFSTWPSLDRARDAAREIVASRLAACVNILPAATSVYIWNHEIQEDTEHLVIAKTMSDRYAELERRMLALHPYELPEIVAFPISVGLPDYLAWVESQTRPAN